MSDVITNDVDECAAVMERVLEEAYPSLEIFAGIIRLIAEFSKSYGERIAPRAKSRTAGANRPTGCCL